MNDQVIPVAARNAAWLVLASRYPNADLIYSKDFARQLDKALEAAARHMPTTRPGIKG